MNRFLAFLLALVFATVSVSSACVAAPSDWIRFTLSSQRGSSEIQASFQEESRGRHDNHWSTGVPPSQLIGLDVSGFRGPGTHPLRFAVVREAGRLDCSGQGGRGHASGNCAFAADPAFTDLLVRRGIGRPTREQAFSLMTLDVRREIVEALAAARYPAPSIDNLMELTAVGVDGRYIAELARAGYRPRTIKSLVEFRALGITPEWIGGFARMGYADIPSDELAELKALDITPEFVSGFDRLGYGRLPVDKLVELKALNITPEFVRSVTQRGESMPPVSDLVELKMFGRRR
jgi:hypothetical protein